MLLLKQPRPPLSRIERSALPDIAPSFIAHLGSTDRASAIKLSTFAPKRDTQSLLSPCSVRGARVSGGYQLADTHLSLSAHTVSCPPLRRRSPPQPSHAQARRVRLSVGSCQLPVLYVARNHHRARQAPTSLPRNRAPLSYNAHLRSGLALAETFAKCFGCALPRSRSLGSSLRRGPCSPPLASRSSLAQLSRGYYSTIAKQE